MAHNTNTSGASTTSYLDYSLNNHSTTAVKYKSFYEVENEINEEKRNLVIIRPNLIADFSDRYFKALNNIS